MEAFDRALELINGQDSYNTSTVGMGFMKAEDKFYVPLSVAANPFAAGIVGTKENRADSAMIITLVAANFPRFPADKKDVAMKVSMLRAMAFAAGWFDNQKETVRTADPSDGEVQAAKAFCLSLKAEVIEAYKKVAFVMPMLTEVVFRQMGHHFITGDSGAYVKKYRALEASAMISSEVSLIGLSGGDLYHSALHWISPKTVRQVVSAQRGTDRVPESVKIRASALPAGCALIGVVNATMTAVASVDLNQAVERHMGVSVADLAASSAKVAADPARYHVSHFAYGVPGLTAAEAAEFAAMKAAAEKLAPLVLGLIRGMGRKTNLFNAKAIEKFAMASPAITAKARNFMRATLDTKIKCIDDIFVTQAGAWAKKVEDDAD